MTEELKHRLADRFTTSELIELLSVDTYDLVSALEAYDGFTVFDDETIEDLEEIMLHGTKE